MLSLGRNAKREPTEPRHAPRRSLAAPVIALAFAACTESKPAETVSTEAESQNVGSSRRPRADHQRHGSGRRRAARDARPCRLLRQPARRPDRAAKFPASSLRAYGIGVAPALTDKPDTGHHHLLIDTTLTDEDKQFAIPKDDKHMHFGGGQTEVVLPAQPRPAHAAARLWRPEPRTSQADANHVGEDYR